MDKEFYMRHFTWEYAKAEHRRLWADRAFAVSVLVALSFIVLSLFVNYAAVKFTAREAGNATTDILLDNLPVVNIDIIFSEGALVFAIFVIILLVLEPKTIPYTLKSVALFVCVRSVFVSMTHLAPYPDLIATDLNDLRYLSSGADLFFSGHTGLPFLLALLFWDSGWLRRIFLACSVIAAASVILGHLHYTIDVVSAFFITYGIERIARKAFSKDFRQFKCGLAQVKI